MNKELIPLLTSPLRPHRKGFKGACGGRSNRNNSSSPGFRSLNFAPPLLGNLDPFRFHGVAFDVAGFYWAEGSGSNMEGDHGRAHPLSLSV